MAGARLNIVILHPQESTHRASRLAVDLALKLAMDLDMLSEFISKNELYHIEMQMLYVLVDILGVTNGSEPESVAEQCKSYFKALRRERGEPVE